MNARGKQKFVVVVAAALCIFFSSPCISVFTVFAETASAADQESFGTKKETTTTEEALKALKKHFEKKDIVIGQVAER